jgi:hypothetical protein
MAVYTEVTEEDLDAFLAAYDLGAVLSLKGIAEGVENSNYLLRTEKGTFILTLYEKRVNEADLPFFLNLMNHLAARGLTCPQPIRAKNGEALGIKAKASGNRPQQPIVNQFFYWLRASRLETERVAGLINKKAQNPRCASHVERLKDGPFPAVGFTFHDRDGTHALHREHVEDHERDTNKRGEECATVRPFR